MLPINPPNELYPYQNTHRPNRSPSLVSAKPLNSPNINPIIAAMISASCCSRLQFSGFIFFFPLSLQLGPLRSHAFKRRTRAMGVYDGSVSNSSSESFSTCGGQKPPNTAKGVRAAFRSAGPDAPPPRSTPGSQPP